jgi:hypothetical protein
MGRFSTHRDADYQPGASKIIDAQFWNGLLLPERSQTVDDARSGGELGFARA